MDERVAGQKVWKFQSLTSAKSFQAKAADTTVIVLGDDERFWVVLGRAAEVLIRAGYEAV